MSELLRHAFQEATEQAANLPSQPVGAVIIVFADDGTAAPVLAGDEQSIPLVIGRLGEVVRHMVADIAGQIALQRQDEPQAPDEALPHDDRSDLLNAERIAAAAIKRVRGR